MGLLLKTEWIFKYKSTRHPAVECGYMYTLYYVHYRGVGLHTYVVIALYISIQMNSTEFIKMIYVTFLFSTKKSDLYLYHSIAALLSAKSFSCYHMFICCELNPNLANESIYVHIVVQGISVYVSHIWRWLRIAGSFKT